MARKVHRLTARSVATAHKPGYHPDGNGLYLQVSPSGSKSWILRYRLNGRRIDMGLGSALVFSLADAREAAQQARKQLHAGIDPRENRRSQRAAIASTPLFKDIAKALIEERRAGWRNAKHAEQWENTLTTYACPVIGGTRVSEITTRHLLDILRPIWTTKTETATRVRQRVEAVLDAATAHGARQGDNPARWKGHLDKLLPKPEKVARRRHFPSMPYTELPAFMALLRNRAGISARALEFTILTAARTNMVAPARRSEDEGSTWRVPPERMKGNIEHEVPLVPAMRALLDKLPKNDHFLFPGQSKQRPHLSNAAMDALLENMGFNRYTVHGFRSTFKVWASEQTHYPDELSEMALAHVIKDKVKAAYKRTTLLEKRRALMADWARYCGYPDQEAVPTVRAKRRSPAKATARGQESTTQGTG